MSKLSTEANALHAACMASNEEKGEKEDGRPHYFYQADLQPFVNCSVNELVILVQELVDHKLFRGYKQAGITCWSARTKELAVSLSPFSELERMVFDLVEDSGPNGVWSKKIKSLTSIPPNEVQKAIGKLERAGLVKGIKNVKFPAQRVYILHRLAPSEELTGGSFFDAGELDESMVGELCNLIIFHVRSQSWIDSKRKIRRGTSFVSYDEDVEVLKKRKRAVESIENDDVSAKKQKQTIAIEDDSDDNAAVQPGAEQEHAVNGKKRKVDIVDIEDAAPPARVRRRRPSEVRTLQLAYPAGTKEYPTTENILDFLRTCNAIREGKAELLSVDEVQGLINVLVWDDKLEKIRGGYRTVRGVEFNATGMEDDNLDSIVGNGLTEIPCGRCQLISLCRQGTKVSAETCTYYQEWLKT